GIAVNGSATSRNSMRAHPFSSPGRGCGRGAANPGGGARPSRRMRTGPLSCKLGLRPLPVFVLFHPVIAGNPRPPIRRRSRGFPVVILELTGRLQAPVVPGLLFFSCCLQEKNRSTEWVGPRARSLIGASRLAMLAAVQGDNGVQ